MGAKIRFLSYAAISNMVDWLLYPLLLLLFQKNIPIVIGTYATFWLFVDGVTLHKYSKKRADFFGLERIKAGYLYSLLRSYRRFTQTRSELRTLRKRYGRFTKYLLTKDEGVVCCRTLVLLYTQCKEIFLFIKYEIPIVRNIFNLLVLIGTYVKKISKHTRLLTVAVMSIEFNPFLAVVLTKKISDYRLSINDKNMFILSFLIGQTYWALFNLGIIRGIIEIVEIF